METSGKIRAYFRGAWGTKEIGEAGLGLGYLGRTDRKSELQVEGPSCTNALCLEGAGWMGESKINQCG